MFFFDANKLLRGMAPQGVIPSDKSILMETIRIAWPSILESFLVNLVGLIDTIMVSVLGPSAIAAVGLTIQPKFLGLTIFMSLSIAVSAIVARRRGEKDPDDANRVLAQAIILAVGLTVIVSILCVVFANQIIALAGSQPDTHDDAVAYFRIIMGGLIFTTLSLTINAAQKGAGNTKITMITNVTSNLVNLVFNFFLINGVWIFPKLGTSGAALATVIGSIVGCGITIYSALGKSKFINLSGLKKVRFDKKTLSTIANIGTGSLADQVFVRIGFFLYAMVVAKLGTIAFAAHQIGTNLLSISFSFGDGLSVASVALVGRSLGQNRQDLAKIYGGFCHRAGLVFACVLSVVFLSLNKQLFRLFSDDPQILSYGTMIVSLLTVAVFIQISQVVYSGCLRGAGDTKYIAFVSFVSITIVRPGVGWLLCYPLGLGLLGVWLGFVVDQILRYVLTYLRFKEGGWMQLRI